MDHLWRPLSASCFQTCLDASFWHVVTEKKVEHWKLDESPVPIVGYYKNSDAPGLSPRLTVDFESLNTNRPPDANCFSSHGKMFILNTLESFKMSFVQGRVEQVGNEILEEIEKETWLTDPSRLCRFVLVAHVNPKKYLYSFVVCHPVVQVSSALQVESDIKRVGQVFDRRSVEALKEICQEQSAKCNGMFIVLQEADASARPFRLIHFVDPSAKALPSEKLLLVFFDPSTHPVHVGWPLRNLIAAWQHFRPEDQRVRVLCWRISYKSNAIHCNDSFLLTVLCKYSNARGVSKVIHGFERNSDDSIAIRKLDLSDSMEPNKLAENATKLNLNLMRWRIMPELNLPIVYNTTCLLFGAGTLGCNVARCLGAWGVAKITLIDSGRVSYSNPARQSLFTIQDCVNGGKWKHQAAAAALKSICPATQVESYGIHVPTPGSRVDKSEEKKLSETVQLLERLIEQHDVVFLLMDTREGRWLPTVLSAYHSKLTFTVALGFDSYLVLRHGVGWKRGCDYTQSLRCGDKPVDGDDLACYFCCDVVAPGNSTRNRTIDQQCTVTRPGVSSIAAGVAVELLISVLQHPLKARAQATSATDVGDPYSTCLGVVPHQIRGYLSRFEQMSLCVQRFQRCVACSESVIGQYQKCGAQFVIETCNQPLVLENITGLTKLLEQAEDASLIDFVSSDSSC